jgi:DNA-binding transcriptional ArsR family regulator
MLNESEILGRLMEKPDFPPLRGTIEEFNPTIFLNESNKSADLVLALEWENKRRKFVVEFKGQSAPSYLAGAIEQVRAYSAAKPDLLPLVIVPYLGPKSLERLIAAGVSGLDLCGNGVINVPGEWFVFRTGEKNRFPSSLPIKNVYRGASSTVARVFLLRPTYKSVGEIRDEILKRKGDVSLSTVSKVLKALQEDLIISRNEEIRLLQPERLLEQLQNSYRRPWTKPRLQGRINSFGEFLRTAAKVADVNDALIVRHSQTPYVVLPSSNEITSLYVSSSTPFLKEFEFEETSRFPNVEFLETDDPTVYFDRRDTGPIPVISPLQAYLELSKGGKREKEAAEPLRGDLLARRYET